MLSAKEVDVLGGRLGGSGVIDAGTVTIGPGGTLAPGNSPGTLTINGDLGIAGSPFSDDPVRLLGGVLEIEIAGTAAGQYDVLEVSGKVSFAPGSTVHFVLYDTYHPADADEFIFLYASQLVNLGNLGYTISGLPGNFHYQVYADAGSDLHVRFYDEQSGSKEQIRQLPDLLQTGAVPEPSTMALGALGLVLLGWRARRQHSQ